MLNEEIVKTLSPPQREWMRRLYEAWSNPHQLHQWIDASGYPHVNKRTIEAVHKKGLTIRRNVRFKWVGKFWESRIDGPLYTLNDVGSDVGWELKYRFGGEENGCHHD